MGALYKFLNNNNNLLQAIVFFTNFKSFEFKLSVKRTQQYIRPVSMVLRCISTKHLYGIQNIQIQVSRTMDTLLHLV